MSELDFVKAQTAYLAHVSQRTLALSVGRAMLTLNTLIPLVTEAVDIPMLALNGRGPSNTVTLDTALLPKGFVFRPPCVCSAHNMTWLQDLRHGRIFTTVQPQAYVCVRRQAMKQSVRHGWRFTAPQLG
jgi:hypothetical protein